MINNKVSKLVSAAFAAFSLGIAFDAEARPRRSTRGAKYVFFFLGDGMANVQMQAAEAFLTEANGDSHNSGADMLYPENKLNMSKFPVQGMQTTYAEDRFITGSAASATAFASGIKTSIGTIGKASDHSTSYRSVAELAFDAGKKVGVISSVSVDHATPAAYYANVNSRGEYAEIGLQAAASNFNFFGGGGWKVPATETAFTDNGYSIKNTRTDIMALQGAPEDKVVCINPWLQDGQAMPYAMDRPADNVSLAEMTQTAVNCLEDDPDGFFIMVEAGKIDWACHANDAMAAIMDTLAFDDAVGVALSFMAEHPSETLIVVTGDHECGGMALGFAGTGYATAVQALQGQVVSLQKFSDEILPTYENSSYDPANPDGPSSNIDEAMKTLFANNFGLVWDDLNDYEKEQLEDAYDKHMGGATGNTAEEDGIRYKYYNSIAVTLTHILNEQAGIAWTSYSHTGVPVPVLATGFDAYRFNGFYDNTDIAKRIGMAMRIPNRVPVVD